MTFKYKNVYLNETATIAGPYEQLGPLAHTYDKTYDNLYFGKKTFEQAESKLIEESVDLLLYKVKKVKSEIDLHIGGDLLNQLTATNYASRTIGIPLLGIYSACASSVEGLIIGSNMLEAGQIKNFIMTVSSHNASAEKQFRYPVEYGGPKRITSTFTCTGGCSAYLSYNRCGVKVESATVGVVKDMGVSDTYHMGAVMAPAASYVIKKHLDETKREIDYYDLVLTGDLGIYGVKILKDMMQTDYQIKMNNLEDAGTLIFDYEKTKDVHAGGSGPACLPLVAFGDIFNKMQKGELKKVLLVATGALMSPTFVNQKLSIPSIAHAISLEALI